MRRVPASQPGLHPLAELAAVGDQDGAAVEMRLERRADPQRVDRRARSASRSAAHARGHGRARAARTSSPHAAMASRRVRARPRRAARPRAPDRPRSPSAARRSRARPRRRPPGSRAQPAATAGGLRRSARTKSGFLPSRARQSASREQWRAPGAATGSLNPRGLSIGSAGTPVASASRATASRRGPRAIAPPVMMTGRRAAASSASDLLHLRGRGRRRRLAPRRPRAVAPRRPCASSRSPGRLTCTGPGRPLRASSQRARDVLAQPRRVLGHPRGLADRRGRRGLVHLLERAAAELRGGRVPAEQHHRRLGHQRAVERRDRVAGGRARP